MDTDKLTSYRPRHFKIFELVSRQTFEERREKAWQQIDTRLLYTLDQLRDEFGSITINDWWWGGRFSQSGLRTHNSKYYRQYSQHTAGRAADAKPQETDTEKIRQHILNNQDKYPYIGGIELYVPWLHIDVRPRDNGKIITFNK